jgi:serine/threonine-protein kinase
MRSSASAATVSPNVTASGTIVGTLQYMAPEQVEGKPVDQRADIFSFGAIVYEMATGQKAFEGETQASLIGAILRAEPPAISTLQPLSPPALDALVATCLAKDPDERWQSAGDVARQLRMMQGSTSSGASLPKGSIAPRPAGVKLSLPLALGALVVVAALAASLMWTFVPRARDEPRPLTRFTITPPESTPLTSLGGADVIISPDGSRLAYFVETDNGAGVQLYVRELAELEPHVVAGAATSQYQNGGTMNPFFSPNGRSIGLFLPGTGIVRIGLDGGPPTKVLAPEGLYLGAVWAPDDTWIYSVGGALNRASSSGSGKPERLTPDPTTSASAPFAVSPMMLPGGRAVLFGLVAAPSEKVAVLDLKTHEQRIVLDGGTNPSYIAPGRLVFARGTTLMAVPFDPDKLVVMGEPVAVLQGVRHPSINAAADYALSGNGTLVYVPDSGRGASMGTLVWVDRSGSVVAPAVNGALVSPRDPTLSPDGQRVLVATGTPGDGHLWIYDLGGRPPLPLVSEGDNGEGFWSPDGTQIAYGGTGGPAGGNYDILLVPADGSARTPLRVHTVPIPGSVEGWSAAGDLIVLDQVASNIVALPVQDGSVRALIPTSDSQGRCALSADGRWLAYETNRTGAVEIWVMRYPDGAPVRVSQSGGTEPVWSRDGRELYYRQRGAVMAVAVEASDDFRFKPARQLFDGPYAATAAFDPGVRTYDVAADGRFLMIQPLETGEIKAPPSIVVVQNWGEDIKRRVPAH